MSLPKWLQILEQVGPSILLVTPLAPIAPAVVAGIKLAQSIPGATGEQKKAIVQQIVAVAAQGANTQAGTTILDPTMAQDVASKVIDTVVGITGIIHQLPEVPPA